MSAWYRNGTIAVAGKTVTGTGTNFTDNKNGIGPGQALLIPGAGTVKVYEISRVDSATQLTLNDDAGTVAAGQAYAIMSFYSDSVPDFARRLSAQLSYYQAQMDGWQEIMTGTGSITLEAPDGTQVTVSSFKKLTNDMAAKADKVDGAVPVTQGGTGSTTAAGARDKLGLTKQSSLTDSTAGRLLTVGSFGVGTTGPAQGSLGNILPSGIWTTKAVLGGIDNNASMVVLGLDQNTQYQLIVPTLLGTAPKIHLRSKSTTAAYDGQICELYTTGNTTKAADGTLKAASPIARIVKSQEESTRPDIDEQGFFWCGNGTCNDEAQGISISRLGVGEYKIVGSAGLAKSGWRLSPPRDPNGSGDLGIVEAEETEGGGITIRLYKRRYILTEDGDIELVKGVLIDVPANSWIDARLDMPESSAYNQRL